MYILLGRCMLSYVSYQFVDVFTVAHKNHTSVQRYVLMRIRASSTKAARAAIVDPSHPSNTSANRLAAVDMLPTLGADLLRNFLAPNHPAPATSTSNAMSRSSTTSSAVSGTSSAIMSTLPATGLVNSSSFSVNVDHAPEPEAAADREWSHDCLYCDHLGLTWKRTQIHWMSMIKMSTTVWTSLIRHVFKLKLSFLLLVDMALLAETYAELDQAATNGASADIKNLDDDQLTQRFEGLASADTIFVDTTDPQAELDFARDRSSTGMWKTLEQGVKEVDPGYRKRYDLKALESDHVQHLKRSKAELANVRDMSASEARELARGRGADWLQDVSPDPVADADTTTIQVDGHGVAQYMYDRSTQIQDVFGLDADKVRQALVTRIEEPRRRIAEAKKQFKVCRSSCILLFPR